MMSVDPAYSIVSNRAWYITSNAEEMGLEAVEYFNCRNQKRVVFSLNDVPLAELQVSATEDRVDKFTLSMSLMAVDHTGSASSVQDIHRPKDVVYHSVIHGGMEDASYTTEIARAEEMITRHLAGIARDIGLLDAVEALSHSALYNFLKDLASAHVSDRDDKATQLARGYVDAARKSMHVPIHDDDDTNDYFRGILRGCLSIESKHPGHDGARLLTRIARQHVDNVTDPRFQPNIARAKQALYEDGNEEEAGFTP